MGALAWRARAAVLVLGGTIVVHQLVYGLAGVRADAHAHGYFALLTPALFGLVLVLAAEVAFQAFGPTDRPYAPPPRGRVLWPALSALLLGALVTQEATEALLASSGHRHALQELLVAHGLWIALPVCAAVGGVLSLLLRGAAAAAAWCLTVDPVRPATPAPYRVARTSAPAPRRTPRELLGRNLAGRAPPVVVAQ